MDLFIKVIAVYVAVKWVYAIKWETGANHTVIIIQPVIITTYRMV